MWNAKKKEEKEEEATISDIYGFLTMCQLCFKPCI